MIKSTAEASPKTSSLTNMSAMGKKAKKITKFKRIDPILLMFNHLRKAQKYMAAGILNREVESEDEEFVVVSPPATKRNSDYFTVYAMAYPMEDDSDDDGNDDEENDDDDEERTLYANTPNSEDLHTAYTKKDYFSSLFPPFAHPDFSTSTPTLCSSPSYDADSEAQSLSQTRTTIRALKKHDVTSTQNALRLAHEALASGISTLTHLHAQGDRIAGAEDALSEAGIEVSVAGEKIRELKESRSMMHLGNPFVSTERRDRDRQAAYKAKYRELEKERKDIREKDVERQRKWDVALRKCVTVCVAVRTADQQPPVENLVAMAKYQFEPDSEDDEMGDEIEGNLGEMGKVVGMLKGVALDLGREVEEQNERLDGIKKMTDVVVDAVAVNGFALENAAR
jgi:hypothetical protein